MACRSRWRPGVRRRLGHRRRSRWPRPHAAARAAGATARKTVTVATVANPPMQDMDKLPPRIQEGHPDIDVNFAILPENELRDRVTQDIATQAGQYDVVTIGTYEVPIWAKNQWLTKLDDKANAGDYDAADLIPPVKEALTYEGGLYAVPFYGESSFLMYRKDLFAAGRADHAREAHLAAGPASSPRKLHNPAKKMAGICLRGLPGWGEVLAPLNTMILTFGGRWYDESWNAHLTDPATKEAVSSTSTPSASTASRGRRTPASPMPDRDGPGQRRHVVRRDRRRRHRWRTRPPARSRARSATSRRRS